MSSSSRTSPESKVKVALDRYIEFATIYNEKLVRDWCKAVRANFEQAECEDNNGEVFLCSEWTEGYTIEGAVSKYVWLEATDWQSPKFELDLPSNPNPAEVAKQVYHRRPESVMERLEMLAGPPPTEEVFEIHQTLVEELLLAAGQHTGARVSGTGRPALLITPFDAFNRYVEVATIFNKRLIDDFCQAVRSDFDPRPGPEIDENGNEIDNFRLEGYTVEGAISEYMWREASQHLQPAPPREPSPNPSPAELAGQVYHRRPESAVTLLRLLEPPPSAQVFEKHRNAVIGQLQASAGRQDILLPSIPVPEDYLKLLSLSQAIRGGGLPSWNSDWWIFRPSMPFPQLPTYDHWTRDEIAGHFNHDISNVWKLDSREQGDIAWFAYCRPRYRPEVGFHWKVFESRHGDQGLIHDSLAEYIESVTDGLQETMDTDYLWMQCFPQPPFYEQYY